MKILVVYPYFPEPDTNSGSLRLFELLRIFRKANHQLVFLARSANDQKYRNALEDLGIECIADFEANLSKLTTTFQQFLRSHRFDIAIFCHFDIYTYYAPFVRTFLPTCRCILDTVDLHFIRLEREAELSKRPEDVIKAQRVRDREWEAIRNADSVWVVTQQEKDILQKLALAETEKIYVIPNIHRLADTFPGFTERTGIVFLGGYRHAPNVDAVDYFMSDIYPHLSKLLPDLPFTILGSHPPEHFHTYTKQFAHIAVTGFVEDHRSLLFTHRVGIVPLRYGAGMKGKIGEYFSCHLPCVTTTIGAEGMHLKDRQHILLADDAYQFAKSIVELYTNQKLWEQLATEGLDYIHRTLSPESIAPVVLQALQTTQSAKSSQPRWTMASLFTLFGQPAQGWRLFRSSLEALRSGGIAEVMSRFRMWITK